MWNGYIYSNIETSVLFWNSINSSDMNNVLNSKIIGVGILTISKFKYGKYRSLIKLFEYECKFMCHIMKQYPCICYIYL